MNQRTGLFILLGVVGFFVIFALVIGLYVRSTYNGLVEKDQSVEGQWSNVEAQLQRRFDLIPNLVASVQAIFEQEREVFGRLADARARYSGAATVDDRAEAAGQLESALSRLLVIVENYPELRSQANVTQLMDELAGTENRIGVERSRYNESVRTYNNAVKRFPSNIIAGMFGYDEREFFQPTPGSTEPPQVQF
ncbi:MAG: LemA family protein [SAR202 cluster bacterium]|nr:LemA family protein [SAR202 cluster bacterium]